MFRFFLAFFFKLLPKFSYFINCDDCIGKITSKYIRQQPVFTKKKRFEVDEKMIFSSEKKTKNSGNCIYDYAHSFFVENF